MYINIEVLISEKRANIQCDRDASGLEMAEPIEPAELCETNFAIEENPPKKQCVRCRNSDMRKYIIVTAMMMLDSSSSQSEDKEEVLLLIRPNGEDTTHTGYYISSALTYLLAMVTSNMALRWVPYPVQVVGKSAKPIPVLIMGVLFGGKSYSWIRYASVFTIVIGVVMFMLKSDGLNTDPGYKIGWGELLVLFSLAMDGVLGALQDRMRASGAPSGPRMMYCMNMWSTLMLGIAVIATGEGLNTIYFTNRHIEFLGDLALVCLCGCFGQLFIFLMVSGFGPLACSVVTTTRKFFTILFSVFFFGNSLIVRQWIGAVLVFVGLFVDMFFGERRRTSNPALLDNNSQTQQ